MAQMKHTIPGIFLIESSYRSDEQNGLRERYALEEILLASGRRLQHHYIRTRKELNELVKEFRDSRFRYLHLACHGSREGIALTYDTIPFAELASILAPAMDGRRLFISACDSTRSALAIPLFRRSSCYSVVGPRGDIRLHDATMAWALFYSLMSKANRQAMQQAVIRENLQVVCNVLNLKFQAFFNEDGAAHLHVFRPASPR
jgi:hypothetical protein